MPPHSLQPDPLGQRLRHQWYRLIAPALLFTNFAACAVVLGSLGMYALSWGQLGGMLVLQVRQHLPGCVEVNIYDLVCILMQHPSYYRNISF